ncbi:hypothetical protein CN899_07925 [Bacillus thuringiensis]|uniref:Uncharacterized protein n=1 Tax=Bacillus thuringiensis TaxID=1428 RepID=A0A9X7GK33_BACTU|nr:hypothetical protein CN899_07925 [Bacillus thuringiensis]
MIKLVILSSYIFYFRQNEHKINNKCGTNCGQKRVVILYATLSLLYMSIIIFAIKILLLHSMSYLRYSASCLFHSHISRRSRNVKVLTLIHFKSIHM